MIKLMKYLKKSVAPILCIIALLFLQAYCDLALPDYTSKIINIGIQQKGVEDGVPEKIRPETMEYLKRFMDEDTIEKAEDFYIEENGILVLEKGISEEERSEFSEELCKPIMMLMSQMVKASGQVAVTESVGGTGAESEEAGNSMMSVLGIADEGELEKAIDEFPESMLTQAAVSFVQSEYEAMGEDLDQMQMRYLLRVGVQMILMAFVIMLAAICVTFLSSRVAAALGHDLRNSIYEKVMHFSSREYHKFSTASLITRSTNDVQQVQMVMAMMFRIVLYAPILGIGGVMKVLKTDSSMTWILGVAVALIFMLIFVLFMVAMPKFTALQKLIDRLNLVTREILTGIPVIRAFSREQCEEERFEKANLELTKTNLFVNRCMTFMMPLMMLIMNGISVLIIYSGAHAVDNGTMQVGNVMAFIQYAMQIIMSFLMITMMSIMLPRANVAARRIDEILQTEVSIQDPEAPKQPKEDVQGMVEFDHVSFAYPEAGENVLTDISFTAKKGETVAVIGSTGSGKSTLINLIPRFYDVTKGAVRVDGVDVREMTQKELRDRIGYVPQKGVLFSGTIDSNIRYGKTEISEEEVQIAAKIAQAEEFIEAKNDGYASEISQGGTNVSGGQKQRLSIARAIAKQPEIFIFDDSFSALDFKTDQALRRALKEHTKDATTIIVAQRISTILGADRIIVLDDGCMAGIGTHKELMENCEVYRQIAMSQLSEEELA